MTSRARTHPAVGVSSPLSHACRLTCAQGYDLRLRLKDQIVAFNYLVGHQIKIQNDGAAAQAVEDLGPAVLPDNFSFSPRAGHGAGES